MLSIAEYFSLLSKSIRNLPTKSDTERWNSTPEVGAAEVLRLGDQIAIHLATMVNATKDATGPAAGSVGAFYAQLGRTTAQSILDEKRVALTNLLAQFPAIPFTGVQSYWGKFRTFVEAINQDYAQVAALLFGLQKSLPPDQWAALYPSPWVTRLVHPSGATPFAAHSTLVQTSFSDFNPPPPPPDIPAPREFDFGPIKIDIDERRGEYTLPNGDIVYGQVDVSDPGNPSGSIGYSSTSLMDEIESYLETFFDWVSGVFGS